MSPTAAIVAVLDRIQRDALVDAGAWAEDRMRRLAVVMQWIHAGELARRHCEQQGITHGTAPWSGLIGFRAVLAHSTEDEVDYALVHRFSQVDVLEYRQAVLAAVGEAQ